MYQLCFQVNTSIYSFLSDFYEYVEDDEICKYVVDIVFLIDSSMSIKFNYKEELYFVSRLAGRYTFSKKKS